MSTLNNRRFGGGEIKPPPSAPDTSECGASALDDQDVGNRHQLIDHGGLSPAAGGSLAKLRQKGVALRRPGQR